MDFFEYISVMASVILGLGITSLLVAAGRILSPWTHERSYWVFYLWLLVLFLLHVSFWWSLWDLHDASWDYFKFAYVLSGPAILIIATHVFLTRTTGDDEVDLEEHFYGTRRTFFVLLSVLQIWLVLLPELMEGRLASRAPFQAGWLALVLTGLLTGSRRVHAVLAPVALLLLLFVMFYYRMAPGVGPG